MQQANDMSDVIDAPSTALATIETLTPATVFREGGVRSILDRIKAEVAKVEIDISTPAGRKACASLAYKVARSKTALDKMGKDLTDQWRAQAEAVHAERRTIVTELDALAEQVRKPLTDWEDADKARIAAHEEAIRQIEARFTRMPAEATPADFAAAIADLENLPPRDWQEFKGRAEKEIASTLNALRVHHQRAVAREAEAVAEAKRLAEEQERQRQEAARLQAEREAQIAAEAAERARQAAEHKAAQEAAEAERRAAAERDRIQAEARAAAEASVRREHEAAEATARAEREKAEAERRTRESEERAEKARIAAERQREADRVAAERREEKARRDAAEAERKRAADQAAAERAAAEERERNIAHRRTINRAARLAIEKAMDAVEGSGSDMATIRAQAVVEAIAKREVPNVTISY